MSVLKIIYVNKMNIEEFFQDKDEDEVEEDDGESDGLTNI